MKSVKTKTKAQVSTKTTVDTKTEVVNTIKDHARKWVDNEVQRKEHTSLAGKFKKKVDEEAKKVKQLYEDNGITEQIEVTRQYQGKSYTVTIGEIDGRSTTNVDTNAIFDQYKNGEISEKDIRKMFESITKVSVEKTLGAGASMFLTTETPKEVKIKL